MSEDTRPSPEHSTPKTLRADGTERFEMIDLLGEGGAGRVLLCHDRALDRRVALKMGRPDVKRSGRIIEREARILGQLEHPHIVPIYDLSDDVECGSFYVMRLLAQPTLEDAMRALREGQSKLSHGLLLRKFIQVCEAIAYAHHRGIVHCDLKPANVLLGAFGEVFVADWGFAHIIGQNRRSIGGTAGFMPPEQLAQQQDRMDGRVDIFALGVMLYLLLTDEMPFEPVDFNGWRAAEARGETPFRTALRPSECVPGRRIPPELDDLCMSALALDPNERLASAWHMARELEQFLEGTRDKKRRRRRADELHAEGVALTSAYRDLHASRPERLRELAELRAGTPPWQSDRQALADAEDQLAVLDALAARTLQTALSMFERALDEAEDHAGARQALAQLFWMRSEESRGDELLRRHYEELAFEHDDGTVRARLGRGGTLRLEAPDFAELVLTSDAGEVKRATPIPEMLVLDGGHYVATFVGEPAVEVPLLVRAGRETLLAVGAAPRDPAEVLVPAGAALVGGHDASIWGRDLAEVHVDAFVIGRLPVTFEEYLAFVSETGDEALLPRNDVGEPLASVEDIRVPVYGVTLAAARAYAARRAQQSGLPWRLPSEIEWEKAARGVDGRAYPWGIRFDPLRCCTRESQAGPSRLQPVGAIDGDVSPYGVRDLAGGIADWAEPLSGELAVSKGGAWCDWASDCHAGARRTYRADEHTTRVGFRLARRV